MSHSQYVYLLLEYSYNMMYSPEFNQDDLGAIATVLSLVNLGNDLIMHLDAAHVFSLIFCVLEKISLQGRPLYMFWGCL